MSDEKQINLSTLSPSELTQKLAFELQEKEQIRHNFEETKKEWIEEKKRISEILKDREIELKQANERLQVYYQKIEDLKEMVEEMEKQKISLEKRNEDLYKHIEKQKNYALAKAIRMQVNIEKVLESLKQLKEWRKIFCKEVESYQLLKEERKNNEEASYRFFKSVEQKEISNLMLKQEKEKIIAITKERNKNIYIKMSDLKDQIKNFENFSFKKANENIVDLQTNTMKDLEHLNQMIINFSGVYHGNKEKLEELCIKFDQLANIVEKDQDFKNLETENLGKDDIIRKIELLLILKNKKMQYAVEKESQLKKEFEEKCKKIDGNHKIELDSIKIKYNNDLKLQLDDYFNKLTQLSKANEDLKNQIQDYDLRKVGFQLEKELLTEKISELNHIIDNLKQEFNNNLFLNQKLTDELTAKNKEADNLIKNVKELQTTNEDICLKMHFLQEELNNLSEDSQNKYQTIEDLNRQLEVHNLKNQEYEKKIDELKLRIETLNKEITELQKELQLEKEFDRINQGLVDSKINDFELLSKKLKEESENARNQLNIQENNLNQLHQEKTFLLTTCNQYKKDLNVNQKEMNNYKNIIADLNLKLEEGSKQLLNKTFEFDSTQQKLLNILAESDILKKNNAEILNLLEKSNIELKSLNSEKEEAFINLKKKELAFLLEKERIIKENESNVISLINDIKKKEDLIRKLNEKTDLLQVKEKEIETQSFERNKEAGLLLGLLRSFKIIIIYIRKEIPILKEQIKLIKNELNNFSLNSILNPETLILEIKDLFEQPNTREKPKRIKLQQHPDENIPSIELKEKEMEQDQLLIKKYRSLFELVVEKLLKAANLDEETGKYLAKEIYKNSPNFDDRPMNDLILIIDGLVNVLKEGYDKKIVEEVKEQLNESFFISEENQRIVQLEEQLSIIKFENSHVGKKYKDILLKYYTDLKKYKNEFLSIKFIYEQDKEEIKGNIQQLNKIKEGLNKERHQKNKKLNSLKCQLTELKCSLMNLNIGESLKTIEFNQFFNSENITILLKNFNSRRFSNIFKNLSKILSSQTQKIEKELFSKINEGFLKLDNLQNSLTQRRHIYIPQPSNFLNVLGSAINKNKTIARSGKGMELNICLDYGRRENLITREQLENIKNWNKISLMRLQTINLNFAQILKSLLYIPNNVNQEHQRVINCFMNVVSFLEEYERKIKEFDENDREEGNINESVPNFTESAMLLNSFIKGLSDIQGKFFFVSNKAKQFIQEAISRGKNRQLMEFFKSLKEKEEDSIDMKSRSIFKINKIIN